MINYYIIAGVRSILAFKDLDLSYLPNTGLAAANIEVLALRVALQFLNITN
jgi:hypothetical protein